MERSNASVPVILEAIQEKSEADALIAQIGGKSFAQVSRNGC
ncbi:MAG: hypothetical protein U0T78_09210 [Cloacibacterium normanense]